MPDWLCGICNPTEWSFGFEIRQIKGENYLFAFFFFGSFQTYESPGRDLQLFSVPMVFYAEISGSTVCLDFR